MRTESTAVQPQKSPPPSELPDLVAEELEDVTIRVVRLDQLAPGASAPPAPLLAAAAPSSAPPRDTSPPAAQSAPAAAISPEPAVRNTPPARAASAPAAR